jgi:hypothetical protein
LAGLGYMYQGCTEGREPALARDAGDVPEQAGRVFFLPRRQLVARLRSQRRGELLQTGCLDRQERFGRHDELSFGDIEARAGQVRFEFAWVREGRCACLAGEHEI